MNTVQLTGIRELTAQELNEIAGGVSTHAKVVVHGITLWTYDETDHATSWKGPDGVRHTVWKD